MSNIILVSVPQIPIRGRMVPPRDAVEEDRRVFGLGFFLHGAVM